MVKFGCAVTFVLLACFSMIAQTGPVPAGNIEPQAPPKRAEGVSAPKVIYNPDPEYSEKARQAKFQGVCVLFLMVGTDGIPQDIRVARSLGLGLDEKAIEAVKKWRFEPARRNGVPVAVTVNVEVAFRLYPELATNPEIARLTPKALSGDLEATTRLGLAYLNGDGTAADSARGMKLLEYAAQRGSPHAQFELAQQIVKSPSEQGVPDYVSAYAWYGIAKRNGHKVKDKVFQELESKMTADQVADAHSRIEKWQPTPANKSQL
jgi:TonB family protein